MRRVNATELACGLVFALVLAAILQDHLARAARPQGDTWTNVHESTRVLQAALAKARNAAPVRATTSPPAHTDPVALARANTLIDEALRSGRWDRSQAKEFRPLLAQLGGPDRDAVFLRMAHAINSRAIIVNIPGGPPF